MSGLNEIHRSVMGIPRKYYNNSGPHHAAGCSSSSSNLYCLYGFPLRVLERDLSEPYIVT